MNHYDGPMRNTEQHLDHIYYTLFCRCTALLHLFLSATASHTIMCSQDHFPEPNWHTLDFLHPILLCRITYRAPLEMLVPVVKMLVVVGLNLGRYMVYPFYVLELLRFFRVRGLNCWSWYRVEWVAMASVLRWWYNHFVERKIALRVQGLWYCCELWQVG